MIVLIGTARSSLLIGVLPANGNALSIFEEYFLVWNNFFGVEWGAPRVMALNGYEISNIQTSITKYEHPGFLLAFCIMKSIRELLESLSTSSRAQFSPPGDIEAYHGDDVVFAKIIQETVEETEQSIDDLLEKIKAWEKNTKETVFCKKSETMQLFRFASQVYHRMYTHFLSIYHEPMTPETRDYVWEALTNLAETARSRVDVHGKPEIWKKMMDARSEVSKSKEMEYLVHGRFFSVPADRPIELMTMVMNGIRGEWVEEMIPYYKLCALCHLLEISTAP